MSTYKTRTHGTVRQIGTKFPTTGNGHSFKDADLRAWSVEHNGRPDKEKLTTGKRVILIVGIPGAGKTTLMRALAYDLGIDVNKPGNVHEKGDVTIVGFYHKKQYGTDRIALSKKFYPLLREQIRAGKKVIIAEGALLGSTRQSPEIEETKRLIVKEGYTPIVLNYEIPISVAKTRFFHKGKKTVKTPGLKVDGTDPAGSFKDKARTRAAESYVDFAKSVQKRNEALIQKLSQIGGITREIKAVSGVSDENGKSADKSANEVRSLLKI